MSKSTRILLLALILSLFLAACVPASQPPVPEPLSQYKQQKSDVMENSGYVPEPPLGTYPAADYHLDSFVNTERVYFLADPNGDGTYTIFKIPAINFQVSIMNIRSDFAGRSACVSVEVKKVNDQLTVLCQR